jgi:hypothetical protein
MAPTIDRVPFPDKLPGEFFVIVRDRSREKYILYVDDAEHSSFELPKEMRQVLDLFKRWNVFQIGTRAHDMAREFGAAQAILGTDRVVALYKKIGVDEALKWTDGQENTRGPVQMPSLS